MKRKKKTIATLLLAILTTISAALACAHDPPNIDYTTQVSQDPSAGGGPTRANQKTLGKLDNDTDTNFSFVEHSKQSAGKTKTVPARKTARWDERWKELRTLYCPPTPFLKKSGIPIEWREEVTAVTGVISEVDEEKNWFRLINVKNVDRIIIRPMDRDAGTRKRLRDVKPPLIITMTNGKYEIFPQSSLEVGMMVQINLSRDPRWTCVYTRYIFVY